MALLPDSTASQSTSRRDAAIGIDGIRNRNSANNGITHTDKVGWQWWEVKLGCESYIDRIEIFNRQDEAMERIRNAVVVVDGRGVGVTTTVELKYVFNVRSRGL